MSGDLLWHPSAEAVEKSQLTAFARRVAASHGVAPEDYAALQRQRWSVRSRRGFWRALLELLRRPVADAPRWGARLARDAGARVVSRRRR